MNLKATGVIIPAYNAAKTITQLITDLIAFGFPKENIILIDDGSKDATSKIGEGLAIDVIKSEKNMGKGWALRLGFARARTKGLEKVITIDADGQHQVSQIGNFLAWQDSYDMIVGSRRADLQAMPFLRQISNRTVSLVVSLLSNNYFPDVQCGYRLINLRIFDKIVLKTKNYQTESELVLKSAQVGYKIGFVSVKAVYNNEPSYIMPVLDTIRFIIMAVKVLWH